MAYPETTEVEDRERWTWANCEFMDRPDDLDRVLATATYKRDWRFHRWSNLLQVKAAKSVNTRTGETGFGIVGTKTLDFPVVNGNGLLYDMIVAMECHEAGEWFRVDGYLPYDPHA